MRSTIHYLGYAEQFLDLDIYISTWDIQSWILDGPMATADFPNLYAHDVDDALFKHIGLPQ